MISKKKRISDQNLLDYMEVLYKPNLYGITEVYKFVKRNCRKRYDNE